ncbi:ABC transporter substrate-binding protein [Pedobacter sp. PACM 27299]|uniref:heme/hemin ABC transporter substrate-binding protein n=1 Tax=Pedobacter sp. PACM 27299 TaxID=1727164 RepID=UPI000706AFAB|nr:ABC transporter substrate-binding protein [Pedobacter sp. PACM 27299]ALL08650.1 ABC transporter substrate-binding protein [Pedobacter sp. PACM 27299]
MKYKLIILCCSVWALSACNAGADKKTSDQQLDSVKIVSLNGTISEIVAGLGLEKNIVGTDITSNYPESLKSKPKVGHNRRINAEGVLSLQPNIVIGMAKEMSPQLATQFKAAGIRLILFDQEFTAEGTKKLIHAVADSLQYTAKADSLAKAFETQLAEAQAHVNNTKKPKVLFIYARGTGTMMVGGTGTPVEKVIEMAGGVNAITEFEEYKPLTSEALVKANPDVLLLFDDGLESLGGIPGLLKVQGVAETNAGKNKRIVTMQGEMLTSFGPRLGQAVTSLAEKIK